MAFASSNITSFNQVSGGRSLSPTVYSISYNGPLADWTTSINTLLKAWLDSVGANAGDGVFLLTTDSTNAQNLGVLRAVDATKTGLAIATVTNPT